MSRWTAEVRLERARLALIDPLGELDAVLPLSWKAATAVIRGMAQVHRDSPVRPAKARRDDALVLDELGANRAKGYGVVHCPAHEDRSPSLSWNMTGGKLLLKCHAGCTWDEILGAIGQLNPNLAYPTR